MVAGAGGGSCAETHQPGTYMIAYAGHGGELNASDVTKFTKGGTQDIGTLGIGANGKDYGEGGGGSSGGAGAGYRGGIDQTVFTKTYFVGASAAGGSSYISGHYGRKSPSPEENNLSSIDDRFHFSTLFFENTLMIDGSKHMPDPHGQDIIGHSGNGEAAITIISSYYYTSQPDIYMFNFYFIQYSIFIIYGS